MKNFAKLITCFMILISGLSGEATEVTSLNAPTIKSEKMIKKGNIELDGGFSFNSNKLVESFSFSPAVGLFFIDRFVLGSQFLITGSKQKTTDYYSQSVGFGPYIKYYFFETESWVFNFNQQFIFKTALDNSSSKNGLTYLGAKYFIAPDVAFGIDAGTEYSMDSSNLQVSNLKILGKYSIYY